MKSKSELQLEREIRILKTKLRIAENSKEILKRDLDRIKHGIKTTNAEMIVDGNDMIDWGWQLKIDL